jgi:DNA polymerase III sliding clamp (beta) subunit (PCNA family)
MGKFKIQQENLIKGLSLCVKAIKPKSIIPAHGRFVFRIKDGLMRIKGLSHAIGIYSYPIEVEGDDMDFAVEAIEFYRLINSLSGELNCLFTSDKSSFKIKTKTGNYTLFAEEPLHYPIQDIRGATNVCKISSLELTEAIKCASEVVQPDTLRPIIENVCLDLKPEGSLMVGAAHHGMAIKSDIECEILDGSQVLIPLEVCHILKVVANGDLNISENNSYVIYDNGNGSRVVQNKTVGPYPEYKKLIPDTKDAVKVDIDKSVLEGAIYRLISIAAQGLVVLEFKSSGHLLIKGNDIDHGRDGLETVECKCSDNIHVIVNGNLLLNLLKSRKSSILHFNVINEKRPLVITGDDNIISLLMPFTI